MKASASVPGSCSSGYCCSGNGWPEICDAGNNQIGFTLDEGFGDSLSCVITYYNSVSDVCSFPNNTCQDTYTVPFTPVITTVSDLDRSWAGPPTDYTCAQYYDGDVGQLSMYGVDDEGGMSVQGLYYIQHRGCSCAKSYINQYCLGQTGSNCACSIYNGGCSQQVTGNPSQVPITFGSFIRADAINDCTPNNPSAFSTWGGISGWVMVSDPTHTGDTCCETGYVPAGRGVCAPVITDNGSISVSSVNVATGQSVKGSWSFSGQTDPCDGSHGGSCGPSVFQSSANYSSLPMGNYTLTPASTNDPSGAYTLQSVQRSDLALKPKATGLLATIQNIFSSILTANADTVTVNPSP